jgi:hypothetical protein
VSMTSHHPVNPLLLATPVCGVLLVPRHVPGAPEPERYH